MPMRFYNTKKYSEEIPVPAVLYEGRSVTYRWRETLSSAMLRLVQLILCSSFLPCFIMEGVTLSSITELVWMFSQGFRPDPNVCNVNLPVLHSSDEIPWNMELENGEKGIVWICGEKGLSVIYFPRSTKNTIKVWSSVREYGKPKGSPLKRPPWLDAWHPVRRTPKCNINPIKRIWMLSKDTFQGS